MTETLRISAQADYAIRALAELASSGTDRLMAAETIAERQAMPVRFLLAILNDLRRAGIVESRRGQGGGYRLRRNVDDVTLAEVIEAVDPTIAADRPWLRHGNADDSPARQSLQEVWLSLRANIQDVLEHVTIADVMNGRAGQLIQRSTTPRPAPTDTPK